MKAFIDVLSNADPDIYDEAGLPHLRRRHARALEFLQRLCYNNAQHQGPPQEIRRVHDPPTSQTRAKPYQVSDNFQQTTTGPEHSPIEWAMPKSMWDDEFLAQFAGNANLSGMDYWDTLFSGDSLMQDVQITQGFGPTELPNVLRATGT